MMFLWFPHIGKSNFESLVTFPRYQILCTSWSSLLTWSKEWVYFCNFFLLATSDSPYAILSPVADFIQLQANCLHRCMQTNHLWKMPWNVNFIWNGVIAKSASIFSLYKMNDYHINSAISNYNQNHSLVVICELFLMAHFFFCTIFKQPPWSALHHCN